MWLALLLCLYWQDPVLGDPLVHEADLFVKASLPVGLLEQQEIKRNVYSGLTTTIRFEAVTKFSGYGAVKGAARLEIRYEPWTEAFTIKWIDMAGRPQQHELADWESLLAWWRDTRLLVIQLPRPRPLTHTIRLSMEVIPFSSAEQNSARNWLFSHNPGLGDGGLQENENGANLLNLILATSIKRKVIFKKRWRLAHSPIP